MVNQIGGVSEVKVDKSSNFSLSKQGNEPMKQNEERLKAGSLSYEGGSTPDVSVIISGEEKGPFNGEKKKEITPEDAEKMSDALNEFMDKLNCNIQFKYNEKLEFMTIKMINKKTKEVIKEFPPEEILNTMEKTQEWIGIFLDRKA